MNSVHLKKVQFGCGSNRLPGWDNWDKECDITKPLPYANATVDRILCEHVVEHITHKQAWNFFAECHRILTEYGVLRVAVPDPVRIRKHITPAYMKAVQNDGFGNGTAQDAIKAVIFAHGHQAVWTAELLETVLHFVGFQATVCEMGVSSCLSLTGVEQHGKVVGQEIAFVETTVVEGQKRP